MSEVNRKKHSMSVHIAKFLRFFQLQIRGCNHLIRLPACRLRPWIFAFASLLLGVEAEGAEAQSPILNVEKPDLFYFVVDRSASMGDKKLVEPVSGAVIEFLGRAPAGCEVRLVFFSDSATKHWQWRDVGTKQKGAIYEEFRRNFVPGGDTRLYDTVGEAMKAVVPNADQYRQIQLIVLTDGDDNRSRQYRSWESLADLAGPLVDNHPNSLLTVYTLGFVPKDKPGSLWQHVPVLDVTKNFKLQKPRPTADFLLSPEQAAVGEPILFVLKSEVGAESVQWDFGDGETASTMKPAHRYQKVGTYKVSVSAKGSGGEDIKSAVVTVLDKVPLQSRFDWLPSIVRIGQDISLRDRSSGNPTSRTWTIPGQLSRTNRDEVVRFVQPGIVTVGLSLATGTERSSTNRTITVLPLLPSADFDVTPLTVDAGQAITLSARADEKDWIHTWTIGSDLILKGAKQTWKADRTGLVEITHTVEGPGGMSAPAQRTAFVGKNVPLKAQFTHAPRAVRAGQEVTLIDESEFGATTWSWGVPGQPSKNTRTAVTSFASPGKINITLTVKRDDKSDTITQEIDVLPKLAEKPEPSFNIQPRVVKVGERVTFTASDSRPEIRHEWRILGNPPLTGVVAVWVATQSGTIRVTHLVAGENNVSVSRDDEFVVSKPQLVAVKFSAKPLNGVIPVTVHFKSECEGDIAVYRWDFGDGKTSDMKNPEHAFTVPGTYSVRLTVRNIAGEDSSSTEKFEIVAKAPPKPLPVWVKFAVGGVGAVCFLAFIYLTFLKPKPIEGTLKVEFQGARKSFPLYGAEFDLTAASVGAWTPPPGQFTIRNKGGVKLFGAPDGPVTLEHQHAFELKANPGDSESARVTYLAN